MIAVIDVETTGLDATRDRLVECAVVSTDGKVLLNTRVNPEQPIPPEASAVHHLTEADVRKAPLQGVVVKRLTTLATDHHITWAAHNAAFERAFLPELAGSPWICTMRVARHLWPEAPAFGLQVLRYQLKLPVGAVRPHSAQDDAWVTAALLARELRTVTEANGGTSAVDRLISMTATPALLARVSFGRHKGQRWSEVPRDYLRWAVRQEWDDPDVKATIEAALKGRFATPAAGSKGV